MMAAFTEYYKCPEKEAVIKASAIFGGVEIFVPSNINLKVKGTPIFGGVSNKVINKKENEKTIFKMFALWSFIWFFKGT